MANFTKDPDATLDYGWNWATWLDDDTIVTSTWTVETGITKGADSHDTTTTRVWLSGGTVGVSYRATNRVVTADGRIDDRSHRITIQDK